MPVAPPTELAERISRISVSATMKVAADADRLRREGHDVVDFSVGEPDFPTPANVKQAAIDAINHNFTKYTPAGGTADLKAAICNRHKTDYGTDYSPAECAVTVGGKYAIFAVIQALINEGDEVIIPVPYWVSFADIVNYAGGKSVFVESSEEQGFAVTAEAIEAAITPRTKAIIINSPSNPSGAVIPTPELKKIFELAKSRGIWVLADECYCRFLYEGEPFSLASLPGAKETVIVMGSLSKTYAMTGWRVGFLLAPKFVIDACGKLLTHSTSNPNSIAQKAAVEALSGSQESITIMLAEFRKRRDYALERLRAIPGFSCRTPQGAFYAYPNISGVFGKGGIHTPMEFSSKLLAEALVTVVPGEAFGSNNHFRLSYATSMEDLKKGLDRIEEFVKKLA
ncbi:pyridoxal phosphate-dependent aminotransferase [Bryobacter aggregatus]|uniref:pyridoxal phosphate-dependent aminotransferase n=1 Tax=Bryobacter aggregatus TaxID=360054 RepID=UPI0004E1CC9F|nr:pyridoxal phosphate-dependent aminotransferase [Bryobacter aggregatus]